MHLAELWRGYWRVSQPGEIASGAKGDAQEIMPAAWTPTSGDLSYLGRGVQGLPTATTPRLSARRRPTAAFKDTWTLSDVDHAWQSDDRRLCADDVRDLAYAAVKARTETSMPSYLIMMARAARSRSEADCSSRRRACTCIVTLTASHYLKLLHGHSCIRGRQKLRNAIAVGSDFVRAGTRANSERFTT